MDKVRPLKYESPSTGGTETDLYPTEVDPLEDYGSFKGVAFEGNDARLIDLDGSGNLQFLDAGQGTYFRFNKLVKDFGTPAHSLVASVQATANSIKALTVTSNTVQIFTGTTAGQILRTPDATTLLNGHVFEVWNLSTQNVTIQNFSGTSPVVLKPNGVTKVILTDNSTANGTWFLSYALDNGNVFGTQLYFTSAEAETSTNSQTVWSNKLSLVTPSLPSGNYLCQFQFIWRSGNANRILDVRVRRGGVDIQAWKPFTANVADRQLLSGFREQNGISGVQTFTLDFKVGGSSTTVYMQQARMFVWRIG